MIGLCPFPEALCSRREGRQGRQWRHPWGEPFRDIGLDTLTLLLETRQEQREREGETGGANPGARMPTRDAMRCSRIASPSQGNDVEEKDDRRSLEGSWVGTKSGGNAEGAPGAGGK